MVASTATSKALRALLACIAVLLAWDLSRAPASQWSAGAAVSAIHLYQHTLGPLTQGTSARCHFKPSCSRYAEAVIGKYGLMAGGWRAAKRIARCGPWTPMGTVDPP